MSNSTTINFTKKQVEYLMRKTGADDPNEAIEIFAIVIQKERIDPSRLLIYLNKVMEKDGVK